MKQVIGVDPELIRARRKLIRDDAPCNGCGGRLADCEAARGQDPTAPPWFGCCAQGTMMAPCSHQSDRGALTILIQEIEAGIVRPVEAILAERAEREGRIAARIASRTTPDGRVLDTASAMLGQGEWWRRKTGEWARIADMSPGHRYNTAALVMRNATGHALAIASEAIFYADTHDGGDGAQSALDRVASKAQHIALNDPQRAVRESVLYRALTAGLTVQGDGTQPWQKTGGDPMCEIPACGCSGEAHP
jgi:hypothetical protein